jgi:hypothetical protein
MEYSFLLFLDVFHAPLSMALRMLLPVGQAIMPSAFVEENSSVVSHDS